MNSVSGILILSLFANGLMAEGFNQQLLIVSFDGFRQMYLESTLLPWFNYFGDKGVVSRKIQSVFPADTFPNHWSIATGMYSESHGVVSNSFYDPKLDDTFNMNDVEPIWWNQSEPIWQTARQQGKTSAVLYWPGMSVQFDDGAGTPTYYRPKYDGNVPYESRIQDAIGYLMKEKVDLAMLYFSEPDSTGHSSGPGSPKTDIALQRMDWYLSYLLIEIQKAGLEESLNVIICADHGMVNVTQRLYLGNYIDMNAIEQLPAYGASAAIRPKPGTAEEMFANLTLGAEKTGLFKVYYRKDVPYEFHYSNNDRIMDIMVICKIGVYMAKSPNSQGTASHGFDPKEAPMQPIFMARGPAFKRDGYEAEKMFETKDIYAIMAHVIGMTPANNNASLARVIDIFAENNSGARIGITMLPSIALFLFSFLFRF